MHLLSKSNTTYLIYTGWLKLKYPITPPDKMHFLDNRVRLFIPKFLGLYGEILLQF